jgi:PAS domain S-box-containing protein
MLNAVLDALPVGVIIADARGKIIRDNAASRALWGTPSDTANWEGYSDWVGHWPESGRPLNPEEWAIARSLRTGESVRDELVESERSQTGQRRFFLSNSAPVRDRDGRIVAGVVVELDVTEPRRAGERLRESEERFASFMRHLPGLAWIKSLDGRYIYANDAAERAFGVSRARLYGRTDDEVFPPHTAAQFKANDRTVLDSAAGLTAIEALEHNDGVLHRSLVSKFPIADSGGTPKHIGGVAFDVTEMLKAQQDLLEATAQLREADKRKDEFLAMLAHELRNPLAPIRAGLQALRLFAAHEDRKVRIQEIMERQVDHLVRLVDDLLEMARISSGKIELKRQQCDLAAILRHSVDICHTSIQAAGLHLNFSPPDRAIAIDGDMVRLAQVFSNLLNNSARYTPSGGSIDLDVERHERGVIVRVCDTGAGISAEVLPHIFDLFAQGAGGKEQGGLGIGLALVKRLVELHGGSVAAFSEGVGKGAEFVVSLPALPVTSEGVCDKAPVEAPSAASRRVLVVDDTRDVADSLAILLENLGATVRVAYSGADAIGACSEFKPEFIFLDIGMPEMDGFETARRLRDLPSGRSSMLIALTGWGEEAMRRRAAKAGFDHHLTKPADVAELERLLRYGRVP